MRIVPRRAGTEIESPFRTPEQLALAMPLVAMIGLMVVVSAVATGGSGRMIALVAVGGFGLCAVAPMALIDVYVTRPLRAALAQMRAARDGRASEGGFASGIVADLVHLARDVQAAHARLGPFGEALAQHEKKIAADDDAMRNLRPQTDARAEGGARADIAELVEAVKTLRAAPAAGLDGAVERLESMLVYLAEALDRIEARDRQIEGGVGQVEQGIVDLTRLVAREAETLHGALSSGDLGVRADIAAAVADEKAGRTRVLERMDVLETRLGARTAPPDARLADDLRALVETMARQAKGLAPAAIVEALRARLGVGEDLRPEIGGLAEAVSRLAERASAAPGRIADALRAELHPVAAELSRGIDALAARLDKAGRADFAQVVAESLSAQSEAQARRLDDIERRVVDPLIAIGADLTALKRAADDIGETFTERLVANFEAVEALAAKLPGEAVGLLSERLGEADARMTAGLADAAGRLEAAWSAHCDRFEAAAAKIEAGDPRLVEVVDMSGRVQTRLGELASDTRSLAARIDSAALLPARDALADATQRFEAAQTRLAAAAAQIEAGVPILAAAPQEMQAQLSGFAETLRAQSGALVALDPARRTLADAAQRFDAAQIQLANAAAEIAAADTGLAATAQAIGALAHILPEVSRDLGETQARWRETVGGFEAATQKLAALAQSDVRGIDALRGDVCAVGAAVAAQSQETAAALSQALRDLAASQARREAAVAERFDAPGVLQALDALRTDFAATAAAAAQSFDAAAQHLTRTVEDRVETIRRGELWPAIAAAQSAAQDLNTAHAGLFAHVEALKAALISDRSGFAALRLDVVEAFAAVTAIAERADASMREVAAQRALGPENGAATLAADAGAALEALRASAQALDVAGLSQKLDRLAQAQDRAVRALESRLSALAVTAPEVRELAVRLQDAMAQRGRNVVEAVEENNARLDALARLHDERLDGLERRL